MNGLHLCLAGSLALLFFPGSVIGFAATEPNELANLLPERLERPFLHFNRQDLEKMRKAVTTHERAREVYWRLVSEADRLLEMPVSREVPARTTGPSPYYDGWRDEYERYYEELGRNCYLLAFVYQMTGEEKYAAKSYEFAEALCVLDSWVYTSEKFEALYWMGKPFGAKWNEEEDNEIVYSFDLSAARVARQLAATYDWIYSALDDYQRKRIRSALLENAILRVKGNYDYQWWAHAWKTNWLPVCFSGLGLAALALYPEDPQLLDVVAESRDRMYRYLEESTGVEGGFQEGVTYWKYGMENLVLFAAALKNVSGGKVDMFENTHLKRSIRFPVYTFTPPRGSISFGDSYEALQGNWDLYNKLAYEYDQPWMKWLAQFFYEFDPADRLVSGTTTAVTPPMQRVPWTELDLFTIIWPEAEVKPALPGDDEPKSIHFPSIDWVVMRASWKDPRHPLVAAKAGANDDPHHGHLDIGQFAIKYLGEWFVRELGYMQPSDFGYWHYQRRYRDYIYANSLGHNVIHVEGEQQEYGPEFRGKVVEFRSTPQRDYALLDPAGAYPRKNLKDWKRHIVYQKPDFVLLVDEVTAVPGSEIAARVHPGVSFRVQDRYTMFEGEEGTMAALSLFPREIHLKEDAHPVLARLRAGTFYWAPYVDTVALAASEVTYLVQLFAPVTDEVELREISQNSSVELSDRSLECVISYRGKEERFVFDLTGESAILR